MKRKALGKRQRFEVFKRDSFTCQYCGEQAPDVILHVDHINPVSKGGGNEITNLITSCQSCNSGKSDKLLTDDMAVKKQMNQAKLIQERAAQIKMIADWVKATSGNQEIEQINKIIYEIDKSSLTKFGERNMKKRLKKNPFKDVVRAIYVSWERYGDDYIENLDKVLKYNNASEDERHWMYSVGIIRNRFPSYDKHKLAIKLSLAKETGYPKEDFRKLALESERFYEIINELEYQTKVGYL